MDSHSKQIAEMIRSDRYYEEARAWYQVKYIGPISERTFFLIIASLAGMIAFFAFLAVTMFLPLTDRRAIIVSNDRIDEAVPRLVPLRTPTMSISPALMRFFVLEYVDKRESYTDDNYNANAAFIKAQSDSATYTNYLAQYDRANKQSPAAILGKAGKRIVKINSVVVNDHSDPKTATVHFSTEVLGYSEPLRADWTAVLQFYFTDLVVTPAIDSKTGKPTIKTQDPQFQVVNYALTQTP